MAVVALTVLAADQVTKWWALEALADRRVIEIFWTFQFRLTFNTGASFSLGDGYGQWIALAAIGVVIFLIWQGRTITSTMGAIALGLVLGGSVGNLADRAFRGDEGFLSGAVVDFIDPQWWAVFNLADAAIVVGAGLLILTMFTQAEP